MYQLVREREQYAFSERHCRRLLSSNPACVQRMELQQKLEGHHGCVNTVSFDTEAGDILVSGSDDMQIMMWDWERGTTRLSFSSGHSNNVFQARMMPHTGGSKIVTCAADGQVRLCELPQGTGSGSVSKSLLGQHYSRAHKLALDPLCPAHCFYSCGEDGLVMHYDLRCGTGVPDAQARTRGGSSSSQGGSRNGARRKLLACRGYSKMRGVTREVVGINAIHVNPMCPFQFALGAADPWARVYDVRCTRDQSADTIGPPTLDQVRSRSSLMSDQPLALLCPHHLSQGASPGSLIGDPHITCVMYSKQGELLASYNDENIYLFGAQASRGALGSSSSRRRGGGNGSGEGANPPQQADDRQQQQQHSAKSSPSRRPRETAAGEGPAAAAAAAAGGASAVAAAADGLRYVLEEGEDERPRWRRRQRLVTAGEAAAAAAASASAGDSAGREPTHEQQQQQQQPLLPSAEDGSGLAASQRPSTQPLIDAQLVADKPPPAPDPLSDLPDASATQQEGPQSLSSPPAAAATAAVAGAEAGSAAAAEGGGGLHLPQGLSGYAGVMGGRFYDADSTSRDGVVASYYGHRNSATVKGVAFFGEDDEYICSGSDCGHVFLWDKARGNVVWWEDADSEVVNCLEPHPRLPLVLATSGIEHDIKVWGPTAPGPRPPPAAALRRAMATNHRERQSARDAYSEPEHWLLQLLAAQRRRSAAARRRRAAADAVVGGGGAGTNGQPAAGGAGSSDPNTTTTAAVAAVLATGAEGEEEEEPLLLPPGGVRIVWGGGRRSGRQQRRQGGGAGESEGGEEDDEGALSSSDVDDDELMDEDYDGGSEEGQPCQIS